LGRSAGAGWTFRNPVLFALLARRYPVEIIEDTKRNIGLQPAFSTTHEQREQVAELHNQGYGPSEIGRLTGLDRKQVTRVLKHQGNKGKASVPASSRLPEILALREQGKSLAEIGRLLGFSRKAIGKGLADQQK
jgi:hypothetical protein